MSGVILRGVSPEGSQAHRHNVASGTLAPRKVLRKLSITPVKGRD